METLDVGDPSCRLLGDIAMHITKRLPIAQSRGLVGGGSFGRVSSRGERNLVWAESPEYPGVSRGSSVTSGDCCVDERPSRIRSPVGGGGQYASQQGTGFGAGEEAFATTSSESGETNAIVGGPNR
jgi:hypothetical protein